MTFPKDLCWRDTSHPSARPSSSPQAYCRAYCGHERFGIRECASARLRQQPMIPGTGSSSRGWPSGRERELRDVERDERQATSVLSQGHLQQPDGLFTAAWVWRCRCRTSPRSFGERQYHSVSHSHEMLHQERACRTAPSAPCKHRAWCVSGDLWSSCKPVFHRGCALSRGWETFAGFRKPVRPLLAI